MRRLTSFTLVLATVLLAACSSGSGASDSNGAQGPVVAESSPAAVSEDSSQAQAEPQADREASGDDRAALNGADPIQADDLAADDARPDAEAAEEAAETPVAIAGKPVKETGARQELLTASVRRTVAESYRFRWSIEMGVSPELPEGIILGGDGAVDSSNDAFSMSVDFSPIIDAIDAGFGESEDEDLDSDEFVALFGDRLELIAVGGTLYLKWGLFSGLLGAETPWVSFSEADVGSDVVGNVTGFEQTASPEDFLQLMQDLSDLSEGMADEINGVATTRYSGVLDVVAAMDEYAEDEAAYDSLLSLTDGSLDALQFIPVTIWVDEQGRVRRFEMRMDPSSVEGAEEVSDIEFVFDLFDFGDATQIAAPPSEQVTDVTDLFGGLFDSALTEIAEDFFVDSDLAALRDECAAGGFESCDRLYWESPFDSEEEAFGETCGNRVEAGEVFSCTELAAA
jgi:hypothetical protein